jgi:hypothetical protein
MDTGLGKRVQEAIDKHKDDPLKVLSVLKQLSDEQYAQDQRIAAEAIGEDPDAFPKVCPVTGKEVLDDCHITIEFGYGSDKDCTTYTFSPVADAVGKKVLETIGSMLQSGNIEEFGQDVMDEMFGFKDN